MKKLLTLLTMAMIAIGANAQVVIAEVDWSQKSEWNGEWYSTDYANVTVEQGTGLIIDCTSDGTTNYWEPNVPMISHIPVIEEGGQYQVHFEFTSPVAGELRLDFYSWDGSGATMAYVFDVAEGDNDMIIDFLDYPTPCTDAGIFYQCGKLPGRHIIKNVHVFDLGKGENWTVAGDKIILGTDWDATNKKNRMYTHDCENYTLTKTEIALSKGTYQFKVFKDNSTNISYPSSNASLVINEDGVYNIKFSFNANTKNLTAIATKIEVWTVAGDENLLGVNWDATDNKNNMRIDGENYTLTKTDLTIPRGTYQFKVFKDYAQAESYPTSNASIVIEEDATYTVKFTFNPKTKELSATATKTDGLFFNYISKGKIAELIQNPRKYKGTVIIPSTVTHEGVEYTVNKIAENAFLDCSKLTSVTIPNSVATIGSNAFYNCSGLTSITLPQSVTTIGEYAFSGCRKLSSIAIPNNVTNINSYTFYGCSSLVSVNIPTSVTSIGYSAFRDCTGISSVNIPNSVTSIGSDAFGGCTGLTSVIIPSSVTSLSCFSGCTSLTSVTIPNSVTSIGSNAFTGCTGLTSVNIPSSVTNLSGFASCTGLTSITIPNSVTSIDGSAFQGCTGLTSVTIPNSVTWIYDYAFSDCSKLKSVTIGNNVKYLGYCSFRNCSSLTSIIIGSNVDWIQSLAFSFCSELKDVYCYSNKVLGNDHGDHDRTESNTFESSYIDYATLHVPLDFIDAFRSEKPWKDFGSIVSLEGEDIPEIKKCATPEINYTNGKVSLSCETEGVEFISEVTVADAKKYYDSKFTLSQTYKISVYATKAGYENSDIVTREIVIENGQTSLFGDLNKDGKVNVADHVKLSDIIMNK